MSYCRRTIRAVVGVLLYSSLISFSQQTAEKRGPEHSSSEGTVPGASSLHIKIEGGSIRLEGYSGNRISYSIRHLTAKPLDRSAQEVPHYRIATYKRGETSWLLATPRNDQPPGGSVELMVRVPREVQSVALDTSGGDVTVQGVNGRVEIATGGGELHLNDIGGPVNAETGGRDVNVGRVESDGRFHTGGGSISVGYIKGNLDALTGGGGIVLKTGMRNALLQSGAGDVRVTFCGGELKVEDGGGNLELGNIGGPADIRTEGGNLRLGSAKGFVKAHTTAGNIELNAVPAADATTEVGTIVAKFVGPHTPRRDSLLQTNVGDITVFLSDELPFTVRASVALDNGHTIRSEIAGIHVESVGDGGDVSVMAQGKINGGGPVLEVRTGNGNITFKHLPH